MRKKASETIKKGGNFFKKHYETCKICRSKRIWMDFGKNVKIQVSDVVYDTFRVGESSFLEPPKGIWSSQAVLNVCIPLSPHLSIITTDIDLLARIG